MQGTVKGKDGINVKDRQGRTCFDCQNVKEKVENQKFGTGFSRNWYGPGENGGNCRVQ